MSVTKCLGFMPVVCKESLKIFLNSYLLLYQECEPQFRIADNAIHQHKQSVRMKSSTTLLLTILLHPEMK